MPDKQNYSVIVSYADGTINRYDAPSPEGALTAMAHHYAPGCTISVVHFPGSGRAIQVACLSSKGVLDLGAVEDHVVALWEGLGLP